MSLYSGLAATALSLLTKFGYAVALTRTTGSTYDPITGATVEGTDASVTTTGLIRTYAALLVDGTRILSSDRELVLSNEQVPMPTDKITIGGENWSIVGIPKSIKPDNATDVVFFVQCRK